MTDSDFEIRLARSLRRRAENSVERFDAAMIADAAIGVSRSRPRLLQMALVAAARQERTDLARERECSPLLCDPEWLHAKRIATKQRLSAIAVPEHEGVHAAQAPYEFWSMPN